METKTGGCHCKKVRYEVQIDLSEKVIECNCSHCQIKGLLLQFVPENSFTLTEGEGEMTEYRFNTKKIAHMFCKTCGVEAFAYGEDGSGNKMVAINTRSIDNVDLQELNRVAYDGRSK